MHTLEVFGLDAKQPAKAKKYTYPGSWEECTVAQLAAVAAMNSVGLPKLEVVVPGEEETRRFEIYQGHLRLWLLRQLSGMPDKEFERIAPDGLLELATDDMGIARVKLLPSLDWAVAPPVFAKSLLPTVTVRGVAYTGPGNLLSGFSVLQWGFCDHLLVKLAKTGEKEAMHQLLGALYTEAGSTWDNSGIEARGEALSKLDDRTKLAAVINYRGLREAVRVKYPKCFKGGQADKHGVRGMIVRMAGPKFGTVDQARAADLNDVLIHVEQLILDDERLEALRRKA